MKNLNIFSILLLAFGIFACGTQPDHYVEIDGKRQHVLTLGSGQPVVVFLAGGGCDLTDFDSVQRAISKITKTISYDKPGLGKSELRNSPRTLDHLVDELNILIEKEGVSTVSIVLVGHSMGGDVARYFLHLYPRYIAGMVLIDPGSEYLDQETRKQKTEKQNALDDSLWSKEIETMPMGFRMEAQCYPKHDSLLKTFNISTSIPITLLASIKADGEDSASKEFVDIKWNLYQKFQTKVPQMKIISTEKSGHFIQLDEPKLVIDAITEMVRLVDAAKK